MLIRNQFTSLLQIFWELMLYSSYFQISQYEIIRQYFSREPSSENRLMTPINGPCSLIYRELFSLMIDSVDNRYTIENSNGTAHHFFHFICIIHSTVSNIDVRLPLLMRMVWHLLLALYKEKLCKGKWGWGWKQSKICKGNPQS